jgi:hypothetical protein
MSTYCTHFVFEVEAAFPLPAAPRAPANGKIHTGQTICFHYEKTTKLHQMSLDPISIAFKLFG